MQEEMETAVLFKFQGPGHHSNSIRKLQNKQTQVSQNHGFLVGILVQGV